MVAVAVISDNDLPLSENGLKLVKLNDFSDDFLIQTIRNRCWRVVDHVEPGADEATTQVEEEEEEGGPEACAR